MKDKQMYNLSSINSSQRISGHSPHPVKQVLSTLLAWIRRLHKPDDPRWCKTNKDHLNKTRIVFMNGISCLKMSMTLIRQMLKWSNSWIGCLQIWKISCMLRPNSTNRKCSGRLKKSIEKLNSLRSWWEGRMFHHIRIFRICDLWKWSKKLNKYYLHIIFINSY